MLTIGDYPAVSLAEARAERDEAGRECEAGEWTDDVLPRGAAPPSAHALSTARRTVSRADAR